MRRLSAACPRIHVADRRTVRRNGSATSIAGSEMYRASLSPQPTPSVARVSRGRNDFGLSVAVADLVAAGAWAVGVYVRAMAFAVVYPGEPCVGRRAEPAVRAKLTGLRLLR